MKSQTRHPTDQRPRDDQQRSRQWLCTYAATALVGAVLASSVLLTADAVSVYEGGSLPQVLVLLVAGLVASFGKILPLPQGSGVRLSPVLLGLLLGWLLLSTVSATYLANGRAAWNGFWHVTGLLVFGCFISQLCRSPKVARVAAQLLVVGAVMLSVHAVHQLTVSLPQTRAEYKKDPDRRLAELNLDAPPGSAIRVQYENRLYSTEPLATFALTNSLAAVLSGALLFLGILIVDSVRRRSRDYLAVATGASAWLLLMMVCLWTQSRTAFLSMTLVAVVSAGFAWRQRQHRMRVERTARAARWWAGGVAAASIGLFATLVGILSRDMPILRDAPKSVAFRLEYWQATSRMILDYPLTGVGLGNFQSYYPRYKLETASETIADPHNWLFDIAACCSLPVLALVLIALVMILIRNVSLLGGRTRAADAEAQANALAPITSIGSQANVHEPAIVQALWIGAGGGWLLTVALQWLLQEAVDLEAAGLSWIVGLVALLLMRRAAAPAESVVRGAALAAVVTMLVCLLASGSWQASGIALPLIAWLAVSRFDRRPTNQVETTGMTTAPAGVGPTAGQTALSQPALSKPALWQPALMATLLLAFLFQTWRPVNSSWSFEQQAVAAMQHGDLDSALRSASASQAADPIDPAPYRLIVQTLLYQAEREPPERLEALGLRVEGAIADLLACDPAPNLEWSFAADSLLTLAAAAQRPGPAAEGEQSPIAFTPLARHLLEQAAEYQQGAVERYPSSVALHAQLGMLLTLLDRHDEARQEIERAFALSDATPHLDRKMKKQQIWLPAPLAAFPASAIQRPAAGSRWVLAEPLCQFLRNKQ